MAVSKESIESEIKWYNNEVSLIKEKFITWLKELGHVVEVTEQEVTNNEELSGPYKTSQYHLQIDRDLHISLKPYGIWLVGARGRIELLGPSGREKLVYFYVGGPATTIEIQDCTGKTIDKSIHRCFENVDEDTWYWYDDSSYRKVAKFTKDVIEPLLERLQ